VSLRERIATPAGKRAYVQRLFATIADRYDLITRVLSYGLDRRWKRRLIARAAIQPHQDVLDLACGTGDLLFAAMPHARRAVGLDLTHRMLQLARAKHPAARVLTGDMLALPFGAGTFDVVTTGYGLRNVPDLRAAMREIRRVLRPGGRLLSLDFNRPEDPVVRRAYLAYLSVVGASLGWLLHRDPDTYRYIPESIRLYPGAGGVAAMLREEGFDDVRVTPVLFGLMALHEGRRQDHRERH
jgi:ubiquinone/menaquinone biosynthesis methyltransferase